jgi:hypothetical protein
MGMRERNAGACVHADMKSKGDLIRAKLGTYRLLSDAFLKMGADFKSKAQHLVPLLWR